MPNTIRLQFGFDLITGLSNFVRTAKRVPGVVAQNVGVRSTVVSPSRVTGDVIPGQLAVESHH